MALTDGDVAALARQAVDLLDPDIDISIAPEDRADPYRWGNHAWVVDAGDAGRLYVEADWEPAQALFHLVETLSNDVSETGRFWAVPFPPCFPGHVHPTNVDLEGEAVVLRCPDTGDTVHRLTPDLPG